MKTSSVNVKQWNVTGKGRR